MELQNYVVLEVTRHVILTNFTICNSGNGFGNNNVYELDAGIRIKSNSVIVSNNIFRDNLFGILVYNTSNNSFFKNNFMRFGGSIYNFNSTHTRIIHNSFTYTNGGIIVGETSYDTIKNNVFDNVYFAGLRLWNCSHAEIVSNDITGHNGFGILVSDSFQNRICNNSVSIGLSNSYRSFMLDKSSNNTIRGNHVYNSRWDGMVFFSSSNNNTIIENKLSNNRNSGLVIAYSSGNHVEHNEIVNTDGHSISVYGGSTYNRIINNVISGYEEVSNSLDSGIKIEEKSSDNTIISNIITNHSLHGIDIYSHNNTINSNVIDSNGHDGLHFRHSNDNLISKNIITKNNNGVYLEEISCNNHIEKNSITENIHHGIFIESLSEYNSILSNNFIRNNENAYVESCGNVWRRNYWNRPRILPYRIPGTDRNEIDWFPRFFPINIPTIG